MTSEDYFELKKHKITEENTRQTIRTFAPSSKHLHLHNITTENIKHSLYKPKSKPIVLSRNNENTFTAITTRKDQVASVNDESNPLKTNQKDGSVFLDELQETEVKNIFKRYFPKGTKVAHAQCGCGYRHPYISLPTDPIENTTVETDINKTSKSNSNHSICNKIIIRRNFSTPIENNIRTTSSNSPLFSDFSGGRSKSDSTLERILGSNISQNHVHIDIPNLNNGDFTDEEELEKLLNYSSNITPNKINSPSMCGPHNETLHEFPSKELLVDDVNTIPKEYGNYLLMETKYTQLEDKIKEMENKLKEKEDKISNLEEERDALKNENHSYESKLNDLNDKIVELVYSVPVDNSEPGSSTLESNNIPNATETIGTNTENEEKVSEEKSVQVTPPEELESNQEDTVKYRENQIDQLLKHLSQKEQELEKITSENQVLMEERDFISQNVSYGIDANKKVLELLEKELERIKNEMQVQSEDFSRERKILENEIESLQNQDSKNQEATTNKINHLEKDLNDARKVIESMTAEVNKANEANSKLTKDLEEIQSHKQNLEEDLDSERKRYEELLETLQERTEEDNTNKQVIANTSQQVKIMNLELEALKQILEEKQEIVEDLEGRLTESQQNVEDLLSNKQESSDSAFEQLEDQRAQIESLLGDMKEKEDLLNSLRADLSKLQNQSDMLEEKLEVKENQFNLKCKQVNEMNGEIDMLKDALQSRNVSDSEQNRLLQEKNDQLEEDLNASEEELQKITERIALEKQSFDEERKSLLDMVSEYSDMIKSKESLILEMEIENRELTSLLEIKDSTIEEYTSRLSQLEEENLQLKEQMKTLEDDLENIKRKLDHYEIHSGETGMEIKLERATENCNHLKNQLDESLKEVDDLNTQIFKLKTDLEKSLSTIDQLSERKSPEENQQLIEQVELLKQELEKKEQGISEKMKEIQQGQEDLERFMDNYNNFKHRAEIEINHLQEQVSSSFNELQDKNELICNLNQSLVQHQADHESELQKVDTILKSLQETLNNTNLEIERLKKEKESMEKSGKEKSVDVKELNDLRRENHDLKHQFDDYRQSNEKMQQEVERLLDQLTKGGSGSSSSSMESSPEMVSSDRSKTPHRNGKFSAIIQTSTPTAHATTIDLWKQLRSEILRLKQKNVELAQQIMQVNKVKEETISKYEKELRKFQLEISKYRKVEIDFEKQKTQLMQVEEYGRKLEENNQLLNNHLKQLEHEKVNLLKLQEQTKSELQQLKENLDDLTTENQRLLKAEKKRNLGDKVSPPPSSLVANKKIK